MGGPTAFKRYTCERRNTLSSGEDTQRLKIITTSGRKISSQAPAKSPKMTLNDGHQMPAFGLGIDDHNQSIKHGDISQAVWDAIDVGYRHFDCVWDYMIETEIGVGIKAKIDQGVVKRKDLFIASKLWNTFHRRDLVKVGLDQSLNRLGVSYLDMFLIHYPTAFRGTGNSPERYPKDANRNIAYADVDICDTWNAMEILVHKGLVKSIGVSNFNSKQLERILEMCTIAPAVVQIEIHPYHSNQKLVDFCQAKNIQVVACSPIDEPSLLQDPVLVEISLRHEKSVPQVILRWILQRNIALVPSNKSLLQLNENFDIFDFHLSDEEMRSIFALNRNLRLNTFKEQAGGHREYPFHIEF